MSSKTPYPLSRSIPQSAWRRLTRFDQQVILGLEAVSDTPCVGERDEARGIFKADVGYLARVVDRDRRSVIDALGRAHKKRVVDLALVSVNGDLFVVAAKRGAKVAAFEEAAAMMSGLEAAA